MGSEPHTPRRIVTGVGSDGISRIGRIDDVEEVDYASAYPTQVRDENSPSMWRLWAQDFLPVILPTDGKAPSIAGDPTPDDAAEALRRLGSLPGPYGFTVGVVSFPPGFEQAPFGWHDTVDIIWCLEGELTQVLDSGEEFVLRRGDCLLQHGTNRSMRNLTDSVAVVGTVILGAIRVGPHPPLENGGGFEVTKAPGRFWKYWADGAGVVIS